MESRSSKSHPKGWSPKGARSQELGCGSPQHTGEVALMRGTHPGEYIREDILPALGMTVTDLAEHFGVSRVAMSELVNGRRAMSVGMALRCEQAFGPPARFWLNLQTNYDLSRAEKVPKIGRLVQIVNT